MTTPVNLLDSSGKTLAHVTPSGEVLCSISVQPPLQKQFVQPFRQYLTDDGTSTGSSDMRVNGSSTSVDFYIEASSDCDRYITFLSFVIADAGATLNDFGNIGALSNGGDLFYDSERGTVTIADLLTTNWLYVRMALGNPSFGDGAGAFRASNVSGTSEGYIPILNVTSILPPYGIKLERGTKQRITHRVNDNVTAVDEFTCLAYGFDRFPDE